MSTASAEDRPATSTLAKGLPGRLAQRGSEPLGVIDVRRPQQLYTRVAGWLGQRLPLLNQLLTRDHDGEEQRTGAGNFVYRATPSFPPETPTAFAVGNRFSPTAGVTWPSPTLPATAAGNDRPSPADTVLSAAAVTGPNAAPPGLAPATVVCSADFTPSCGPHLGRVDNAYSVPAVAVTGPSAGPPGTATATVAQSADLTLSGRVSRGRVDIAYPAPAAVTRTATAVSARPLPERLAQRGSEPLGVIDVRRPQQHYTHAAGWLGQRLPLLNQLLTRHHDGGEHGTGAGNFVYRVAQSFPPETPDIFAMGNSFPPTVASPVPTMPVAWAQDERQWPAGASRPAAAVTGTGAESLAVAKITAAQFADLAPSAAGRGESSATPAVTLRVRRQAPLLADAVSALASKPLTETTADGRLDPAAGLLNQPAAPAPLPSSEAMENQLAVSGAQPVATLPLATRAQAPLPIRPRSMARTGAGAGAATVFRDRAITTSLLPGDSLLSAAAPSPTRSAVRDAAPAGDRLIAGAGRLPELQPTAAGPALAIARKAVGAVSPASGARVDATVTAGTLDPTRAGLPDSMPLARRISALQLSESITGTADKPALPVILEKPTAAAADPVPGLVWRKNITASTTAGAGNPGMIDAARAMAVAAYPADGGMVSTAPPIMRAESTNLSADNQPGASSPASMPAWATALDWESLLAQISRRLLRQLTIERERRGGKGW